MLPSGLSLETCGLGLGLGKKDLFTSLPLCRLRVSDYAHATDGRTIDNACQRQMLFTCF